LAKVIVVEWHYLNAMAIDENNEQLKETVGKK
jgi:hypothetical protein